MKQTFSVMHSLLASDDLREFVTNHFDLDPVLACRLLNRGLNDTYIVITEGNRYILRVYRTPWRGRSDVDYEMEVLNFLSGHGVFVSSPVKSKSGEFTSEVYAPEGIRCVTLFTYATGATPRLNPNISYDYGKTAAQIHNLTDGFKSSNRRFRLDFEHLLDKPIETFSPTMKHYDGDLPYVQSWAQAIRQHISMDDMDFGFCHGDLHDWNAHYAEGKLTLFDFDCCGLGFRAYDLAVFLWNLKTNYKGSERENWDAFLNGYRELRPIRETELQSIPWFVAARRIWLAGVYLSNEDVWGTGIIHERFFQTFVEQLKEDEKELGIPILGD